jgi:hypothetical protein
MRVGDEAETKKRIESSAILRTFSHTNYPFGREGTWE